MDLGTKTCTYSSIAQKKFVGLSCMCMTQIRNWFIIYSWHIIFYLNCRIYSFIYKYNPNKCLIVKYLVPWIMLEIKNYFTNCWCGEWLLVNEKSYINGRPRWKIFSSVNNARDEKLFYKKILQTADMMSDYW